MAKSQSKSKQNYSALYKSTNRWKSNRKLKLERQLKLQPNNEQVKRALLDINYRRKKPSTSEWSKTNIAISKLFKMFRGHAGKELFSANPKTQAAALAEPSRKQLKLPTGKVDFSLGARAHNQGVRVWD